MFRLTRAVHVLLAAVSLLGPHWVSPDASVECPPGFDGHDGHCYYFSDTAATFPAAAAQCAALDGRLAEPDCEDEHANELFYSAAFWISPGTSEDCVRGRQSPQDQLPFICQHTPTCPDPPIQESTVISGCTEPYDHEEVCSYACAPGFHMYEGTETSATATCLTGLWHGPYMTCYANCPDPVLNAGVEMAGDSCESPYITGDMCFFDCISGQEPLGGDHDMSCLNGQWIHAAQNQTGVALVCP